nr:non-ribosomal peptide synthetase [uncultured Clostridium sp.]
MNNMKITVPQEEIELYWGKKFLNGVQEGRPFYDNKKDGSYKRGIFCGEIKKDLASGIKSVCKNNELSVFVYLLSAFKILIYKYSDLEEVSIKTPILKHGNPFINDCIVLKDEIYPGKEYKEFLLEAGKTVVDGYKYQEFPVSKWSKLLQNSSEPLVDQFIFIMDELHNGHSVERIIKESKSDIMLQFTPKDHTYVYNIMYNEALFGENTIHQLMECYQKIMEQTLQNPKQKIKDLILIDDKKGLISQCTPVKEHTIHQMFERQAELTPEKIAVVCSEGSYTYSELNKMSNRLAWKLKDLNVHPGTVVGIMTEPDIQVVISILAVLKAGGAYLPIDSNLPSDRVEYMLIDANCAVLLTQSHLEVPKNFKNDVLFLDKSDMSGYEPVNPENENKANDLLYVIYTSGSTGRPKGVMIEHKSIVNFIDWRIKAYSISNEDIFIQMISVSFDGFGANFYSALLAGGKLILPDTKKAKNYGYIKELITEHKVTNLSVVPSIYKALLDHCTKGDFLSLRFVVLAAEYTDKKLLDKSREINSDIMLINEYGPTENSIVTTAFLGMDYNTISMIGKPINNHKVYILNQDKNCLPPGVPGELYVTGPGLARGYMNNEALTGEKFIQNPLNENEIIYNTGDIAKYRADGNLVLIGRSDRQVKIRGYRIELEEIENKLSEQTGVRRVVTVVKEDSNGIKNIYAYVEPDREITQDTLREYLKEKLPQYMIPHHFIFMDSLPLLYNGKIDNKALCEMDDNQNINDRSDTPENKNEKLLYDIWKEVLDMEDIGVTEDFFALGGDSIKAMDIILKLEEKNIFIGVQELFEKPTIRELGKLIPA